MSRAPLTVDRIVDAALARIDRHGLEAFSMRKLGADLGVEAMAIYKHVPDKDALLDLAVAAVYAEIELPDPSAPWDERVRHVAHGLRAAVRSHPHLLTRAVTTPPTFPVVQQRIDTLLGALRDATGDDALAVRHFWVVTAFVSGALLAETASLRDDAADTSATGGAGAPDAATCPSLAALGPLLASCEFAEEFAFGLDTVLAAVPVRRRTRNGRAAPR
jgi:TetR/AcrR family tetracycline transcriptional repressor